MQEPSILALFFLFQGVSLEDIEKAEESLKADKDSTDASTTSHLLPSRNSLISKGNVSAGSGEMATTTGISTATTTTTTIPSTVGGSDGDSKEDRTVMSGYRLRAAEDKNDVIIYVYKSFIIIMCLCQLVYMGMSLHKSHSQSFWVC